MRSAIIQNTPFNPPSLLSEFLTQQNATYSIFTPTNLSNLDLREFDSLILLGGSPNASDDKAYPYLALERQLILDANNLGKKVLGICLGAQLAAVALGGSSQPTKSCEFGWTKIELSKNKFFQNVNPLFFESHGDWIQVPNNVDVIAQNAKGIQAFTFENITALQFHPETDYLQAKRFCSRLCVWEEKFYNSRKQLDFANTHAQKIRENAFQLFNNILA